MSSNKVRCTLGGCQPGRLYVNINQHIANYHTPRKCPQCAYTANRQGLINMHLKNAHPLPDAEINENFRCLACQSIFISKKCLNFHINAVCPVGVTSTGGFCEICQRFFSRISHHRYQFHVPPPRRLPLFPAPGSPIYTLTDWERILREAEEDGNILRAGCARRMIEIYRRRRDINLN